MIHGKRNRQYKRLKALGLSTVLVTGVMSGYALTTQAADANDITTVVGTSDTVEAVELDTNQPPAGGGRGGFGGRGGHDHDQTLSEDAYDPTDLVTIDPEADVTTDADTTTDTEADADATETPEILSEDQVYYDGQYAGDSVRADRWGNMQVVVVVEEGEVTDILIADYPRSTTLSDVISRNAMPTLISEAIEAQDADINMVSGATDTSRAFIESLDSALEDALIVQATESSAQ